MTPTAVLEMAGAPLEEVFEPALKQSAVDHLLRDTASCASPEQIDLVKDKLAALEADMRLINLREIAKLKEAHPEMCDDHIFFIWSRDRNDGLDWRDLSDESVRLSFEIKETKARLRSMSGHTRNLKPWAVAGTKEAKHFRKMTALFIRDCENAGAHLLAEEFRQASEAFADLPPKHQPVRGRSRSTRGSAVRTRGSRRGSSGKTTSGSDPGEGPGDPDPPGLQALTGGETKSQSSRPRHCQGCGLPLADPRPNMRFCRQSPDRCRMRFKRGGLADPVDLESGSIEKLRSDRAAEWKHGGDQKKIARIENQLQEMYGNARRAEGIPALPADFLNSVQQQLAWEMITDGHGQPLGRSNNRARVYR